MFRNSVIQDFTSILKLLLMIWCSQMAEGLSKESYAEGAKNNGQLNIIFENSAASKYSIDKKLKNTEIYWYII